MKKSGCFIVLGFLVVFIVIPGVVLYLIRDSFISEYCPYCGGDGKYETYSQGKPNADGYYFKFEHTHICKYCNGTGLMPRSKARELKKKLDQEAKQKEVRDKKREALKQQQEARKAEPEKADIGKAAPEGGKKTESAKKELKKEEAPTPGTPPQAEPVKKEEKKEPPKPPEKEKTKSRKYDKTAQKTPVKRSSADEALLKKKKQLERKTANDKRAFVYLKRYVDNYNKRIESYRTLRRKAGSSRKIYYNKCISRTEKSKKDYVDKRIKKYKKELAALANEDSEIAKERMLFLKKIIKELYELRRPSPAKGSLSGKTTL